MMEEPTLQSQTAALGEAMRSYRSFHIPGIDSYDVGVKGLLPRLIYNLKNNPDYIILAIVMNFTE